jgi:hypothetical protein
MNILFLLLLSISLATVYGVVTIAVDADGDAPPVASDCYPTPVTGQCTLRSAWEVCTSTSDDCEIFLAPNNNYELSPGIYGAMRLYPDNSITIYGQFSSITSSERATQSLFYYDESPSELSMLVFVEVAFINNGDYQVNGAVLYAEGDLSFMSHGAYYQNNYGSFGGGALVFVSNQEGSIMIINSNFVKNYASYGGSLYFSDCNNVLIEDSNFNSDGAGQGGSMYFDRNNVGVQLIRLSFVDTTASAFGGALGLDSFNHDMLISDTLFLRTTAPNNGGVMRLESQNHRMTIKNCEVEDTFSSQGGGIYLFDNNYDFLIENTVFTGSNADGTGGSLRFYQFNHRATVRGCTFLCNGKWAPVWGGAISLNTDNTNMLISHSHISNCKAGAGGAISVETRNHNFRYVGLIIYILVLIFCLLTPSMCSGWSGLTLLGVKPLRPMVGRYFSRLPTTMLQ